MAVLLAGNIDLEDFEEETPLANYNKRLPLIDNLLHNEVTCSKGPDIEYEQKNHCFGSKLSSPKKAHLSENYNSNGTADYLSCLANVCGAVTPKKTLTEPSDSYSSPISKHDTFERMRLSGQRLQARFCDKENRISPKLQSPRKRHHSGESHGANGTRHNLSCLANVCETRSISPRKKSSNDPGEPWSLANSKSNTIERKQFDSQRLAESLQHKNSNGPKFQSPPKRQLLFENQSADRANNFPCFVTPKKKSNTDHFEPPLTPTANLKMLFSAVSPELRRRDRLREEESNKCRQCISAPQIDEEDEDDDQVLSPKPLFSDCGLVSETESSKMYPAGSRKEKSLGLLCQKFLAKYPIYPDQNAGIDISLDEVAKELAVERRRIYDIVNVLESVEIVSRVAKNKYAWHGKTNLRNTLAKLKALAEREGFQEQMARIKEFEQKKDLDNSFQPFSFTEKCNFDLDSEQAFSNNIPKFLEKSLGIMSQKFLMLFLVLKSRTVNLDLAAKILIGDMTVDKTESSKFKTKIRRLYDIANILTSLELIKKVHVTEIRGRKPAFKYIGPEIDNATDITICSTDGCHRPSSRHSLLDCVKNQKIAHILSKPGKKSIGRSLTSQDDSIALNGPGNGKKAFLRHASFDSICEVAEKERTKLFSVKSPNSSTSQPCSPSKDKNLAQWKQLVSSPKDNPQIIWVQKGNQIHEYHLIPSPGHPVPQTTAMPVTTLNGDSATPVSIPSLTSAHTLVRTHELPVSTVASKILSDATETSQLTPNALLNPPLMTNNHLTPELMKAVLQSLKDPVPVAAPSGSALVDASTQSSPTAEQPSDPTSLTTQSECTNTEKPSKQSQLRESVDRTCEGSGSGENGKRQSPIRVLHLEPEFQIEKSSESEDGKSLETGKDDLAVPLVSEPNDTDKCFRPISSTPVSNSLTHNCNCFFSNQPGTPKLLPLPNQTPPHSVMQLPLLAIASVTASPAQVTNSFSYSNTDINSTLANMSSCGVKIHHLPSPHILTFSPVPTIGITDKSQQSNQTLVAFPVSQQSAMTLASVQLVQSSCNANGQGNIQMKTPTPLNMHNQLTSTPCNQISFQSPHSLFDSQRFATPGSFFRNTPNSNLDSSSSHLSLLAGLKRSNTNVQSQEKPPVCAGSAARRLNLIESP